MVRPPITSDLNRQDGSTSIESIVSISILFLLVLIAGIIFLKQSSFDAGYFNASVMQKGQTGSSIQSIQPGVETQTLKASAAEAPAPQEKASLVIDVVPPAGFSPMSREETFDQVSLSDKIDGKAEGYLAAGFVSLTCLRYVNESDENRWFEIYLYDMGLPRNAFSVYSSQKREGVTAQTFTPFAYSTENAIFFACGGRYLEVISSVRDESLIKDLVVMSKAMVKDLSAEGVELPELKLLPQEGLDAGSITLISKNGFSYDRFDNLFTANYQIGGKRIMAFLSIRDSKADAEGLLKGYDDTISEFVGKERLTPEIAQIPGVIIANVFDEYEIFFAKDNIIAGVHSAPDRKLGEEVALKLYKRICETKK